jgi:hypothetical protein
MNNLPARHRDELLRKMRERYARKARVDGDLHRQRSVVRWEREVNTFDEM